LSRAESLPYNDADTIASEMPRTSERDGRNAVRVGRTSHLREIVGVAIVALAAVCAGLIVAGPALVDPGSAPAERVSSAAASVSAGAGPIALGGATARAGRVDARARPVADVASGGDAAARAGRAPGVAAGPPGAPKGTVPAPGLRGPPTGDRISAAIDRAVERGWLTIDPPGSPPRGMALFPPMGTQPIESGIIVPDGFELPPGYVRHYQVTDGGEQLRPILRYSPDFEFVDENGNVVREPSNDIVQPGDEPEGMPVELLEPPEGEARAGP
jgi:hypothetical protein